MKGFDNKLKPFIVLALLDIVLVISAINNTAVSVAFPEITAYYKTSLVLAGWVLSIFQLVTACSMVLMGKVSDILGRKRTFLICASLFAIGSLFSAIAPNIQLLIAARFIQSLGSGGIMPSMIGIIVELFPNNRQKVIGFNASLYPLGSIIGPSAGAWVVTTFGWQSVFWINVPIVVLAIIPLFFLLKTRKITAAYIDYTGALYLSAFLFTLMIGLSRIAHSESGAGWTATGLLFIGSIIFMILFIRHELNTEDPFIDLAMLRLKPFAATNIYNFVFGTCIYGCSSFIPLYAVTVYHMSTIESGYVLMSRAVSSMFATIISGFFVVKWGYRKPLILGVVILSTSFILFGMEFSQIRIAGIEISSLALLIVIGLFSGLGGGVSHPASENACLDLMPQRTSTIVGVKNMFRQSGGAISIAIITLVLQFIGDMERGFRIVFITAGLILLLTIIVIFAMPDKASQPTQKGH